MFGNFSMQCLLITKLMCQELLGMAYALFFLGMQKHSYFKWYSLIGKFDHKSHKSQETGDFSRYIVVIYWRVRNVLNIILDCFSACSLPELSEDLSYQVPDGSVGYYGNHVAARGQSWATIWGRYNPIRVRPIHLEPILTDTDSNRFWNF